MKNKKHIREAIINNRILKVGSRVKALCKKEFVSEPTWVSGTVVYFFPTTLNMLKSTFDAYFENSSSVIKIKEVIEGGLQVTYFKSLDHLRVFIKTDKRISTNPSSLLRGFGLHLGYNGHVILEGEEEYSVFC